MSDANVCQQGIDSSDSDASTATCIAQNGRVDVITPCGHDHRNASEQIDDALPLARATESLKQLLKH